jgi:ATP-dependent DNA helicase RecG
MAGRGVVRKPAVARIVGPLESGTPIEQSGLTGAMALRRVAGRLGIRTVRDLLFHLPRRYDDLRRLSTAVEMTWLEDGTVASGRLQVVGVHAQATFRRHVERTTARLADGTGFIDATWFGRRFIANRMREGQWVVVSGKIRHFRGTTQLDNPDFQPDDGSALLHVGRIVPVYRLTAGITAQTLRRAMRQALDDIGGRYPDYLPAAVRTTGSVDPHVALVPLGEALEQVHYPSDFPRRDAALARLAFDELLALEVGMVARDRYRRRATGTPIVVPAERAAEAVAAVESALRAQVRARTGSDEPVHLTGDQAAAVNEIVADLARPRPMMRLLQGDVGSGKTAVAALALAFAADAGRQGALLAPTDLLARQHAVALRRFLEPLGHGVTLLTGSLPAGERSRALDELAHPTDGGLLGMTTGRIVVGTHALFQQGVAFEDLAIAVVDEQHRFGVAQREALGAKGISPHILLMTATPIPRTLGQILLSDVDVSDLRALPAGRVRIGTGIRRTEDLAGIGGDPARGAYQLIVREVRAAHRAFVVVPLVEEDVESAARSAVDMGERMPGLLADAAARAGMAADPPVSVGVVHGQMKAADRDATMERFRRGDLDVLVGTTVIEVGVDVPEATVMLILDADRFGLAQLHQLRGRVGRGEAASYCILVSDSIDETAKARLEALATHTDGFDLAELDLELRQEGELLGLSQSGLPSLRIASLHKKEDRAVAARAREIAEKLVGEDGTLLPGAEALAEELRSGWLARVGAGEVLADAADADSDEAMAVASAGGTGARATRGSATAGTAAVASPRTARPRKPAAP